MSLIDGSALKGFSDGLFTALRLNQMGARSAASSRYRQESTRNLELQNEAIEERALYDRLIENPEIQNLLISKIPTGEILKLNAIKPKDFTFDPNNTESLLSSDVANELATITLVDRLGLPKGSRAQIVDASQLFSGTGTIPENSVAIQVINPDGSMGVLTKNGSNADDAEVVFKTKEEMAQHFNSILNTAKSKSGLYNDFLTDQATSELSDAASVKYYNSYVDANSNAKEISNTFSQVMATKPERTPETENDVTNRTAFSLFKQDVQNKLKLLDPTTQREIFNNVELAGTPLNEYQILTRVANEINKINTDASQVGETLKINIPKIESSFLKQLQTFDPIDDQDISAKIASGQTGVGQPRANTYQELIKQISDTRIQEEEKAAASSGRIFPRARKTVLRNRVKKELNDQVKNLMDTENLTRQQAQKRLVDTFGISSRDPVEEGLVIDYIDNFFDDKVNITTIKANPDVIINKTDAAVANPDTRDATINSARNFLVSNNITSQADVARLLDETKIRNRPDPRIVSRMIAAYSVLASVDPERRNLYIPAIQKLADTGSATQTRDQMEKNLLEIQDQRLRRQKQRAEERKDDLSDQITEATNNVAIAYATNEDDAENLRQAEISASNSIRALVNKIFDVTDRGGLVRKDTVSASDENKFINTALLDLARRDIQDRDFLDNLRDMFLETGGDVDFFDRIGGDLRRNIILMDGRLTFLDSQDRLTNQRLTRAEVRSAFGPQLTNYVFQRARENTEERRKRAQ